MDLNKSGQGICHSSGEIFPSYFLILSGTYKIHFSYTYFPFKKFQSTVSLHQLSQEVIYQLQITKMT
jgi:hypothetical protein